MNDAQLDNAGAMLVHRVAEIGFDIATWIDGGAETGEHSPAAIRAGHSAIRTIDAAVHELQAMRSALISGLLADQHERAERYHVEAAADRQAEADRQAAAEQEARILAGPLSERQ
jgi:hypothetical protein